MTKPPFKVLTVGNWLKPDPLINAMHGFSHLPVGFDPKHAERWVNEILEVSIDERLPAEIQEMFAVARGTAIYGLFFYPLFTVADEQMDRLAETAISLRCIAAKAPLSLRKMSAKINWLAKNGILLEKDREMWDTKRELRNAASHSCGQKIMWPGPVGSLKICAQDIEALFGLRSSRWAE